MFEEVEKESMDARLLKYDRTHSLSKMTSIVLHTTLLAANPYNTENVQQKMHVTNGLAANFIMNAHCLS